MKLPIPSRNLQNDFREFDIWITPSLEEITDTDKFKNELSCIIQIFDDLGQATNNFRDEKYCQSIAISQTFAHTCGRSDY